jgi:hypothetical protein
MAAMKPTQQRQYGVKEIAKLFPSLMKIKQKSLRERVAAVWSEAITTGCGGKGWTFAELRVVKFTLLAGDIDMKFVEHLNSCARQCIAISEVLKKSFPLQYSHSARLPHRRRVIGRRRQAPRV